MMYLDRFEAINFRTFKFHGTNLTLHCRACRLNYLAKSYFGIGVDSFNLIVQVATTWRFKLEPLTNCKQKIKTNSQWLSVTNFCPIFSKATQSIRYVLSDNYRNIRIHGEFIHLSPKKVHFRGIPPLCSNFECSVFVSRKENICVWWSDEDAESTSQTSHPGCKQGRSLTVRFSLVLSILYHTNRMALIPNKLFAKRPDQNVGSNLRLTQTDFVWIGFCETIFGFHARFKLNRLKLFSATKVGSGW